MKQTCEILEQDVNNARLELCVAEQKITANQGTLDLFSDKPVAILNCKNVFSKIKAGATIEDGPFNVDCDCIKEHKDCCNRKCSHYPDYLNYVAACDKLVRLKSALNNLKKSRKIEIGK